MFSLMYVRVSYAPVNMIPGARTSVRTSACDVVDDCRTKNENIVTIICRFLVQTAAVAVFSRSFLHPVVGMLQYPEKF